MLNANLNKVLGGSFDFFINLTKNDTFNLNMTTISLNLKKTFFHSYCCIKVYYIPVYNFSCMFGKMLIIKKHYLQFSFEPVYRKALLIIMK